VGACAPHDASQEPLQQDASAAQTAASQTCTLHPGDPLLAQQLLWAAAGSDAKSAKAETTPLSGSNTGRDMLTSVRPRGFQVTTPARCPA